MNYYKRAYKKIKVLFIGIFIRLSLSLSKTETNLFKISKEDKYSGDANELTDIQSDLLRSLYKGEYNKEYVVKFYKILKMSDKVLDGLTKDILLNKLKEHGMDEGNQDLINYLTNDVKYKNIHINKKTDNTEDYPLIDIVKNRIEIINAEEVLLGKKAKKITTIKSKDIDREFLLEEVVDYLHIKKYTEDDVMLEFYINKLFDITNFTNQIKLINNIYYVSKYGEKFEYIINNFFKTNEHNDYIIYKFIGKRI